jgi:(R,R)-butanediol dehydrogenase / meso-butanediol dehydrogenase / diacetyl reductase
MRAAVYHGPRDVRIEQRDEPGELGDHAVRLAVRRVALCGTDAGEYAHGPHMIPLAKRHPGSGHLGPTVLGHEILGEVLAVGGAVDGVAVGDRVVPGAGMWCGECAWCAAGRTNLCARYYTLGLNADGGLTQLLDVPDRMCRIVPAAVPDDAAAMAQPLAVALHAVNRTGVERGEDVVLIGAGGIGLFVLSALVARGANVTVLDIEEDRLRTARDLGARQALDGRTAPDELVERLGGADAVLEASGAPGSPALAGRLVRRGGRLMLIGLQAAPRELDLHDLVLREIDILTSVAHVCGSDLPEAIELLADGRLSAAALDRVIPLDALVSDGLEPLAAGTVAGKVLVDPAA